MTVDSPENDLETEKEVRPLNRLEALRGLRLAIWEGSFATIWSAMTTGVFLTGYALWLGADSLALGLISAIPTFAALVQLVSSYFGDRMPERKRFTAWFSVGGRMLWLPILLLPLVLPRSRTLWPFLAFYTLSYILLNVPVPAYLSWMSDLVPADHRGRYFGRRNMIMGIVGLVVALPAAWFLDLATRRHHWEAFGFGTLFGLGVLGGLLSFFMLLRQAEPPKLPLADDECAPGLAGILSYYRAPFADRNFMRLMRFNILFGLGQNIAAPFFIPYALNVLKFNYTWLQFFATLASVASLASMPLWGYLSDKFGSKPLLAISVVGTFTLPLYWVLATPAHPHLAFGLIAINNLTAGLFWAGFGLLQFNLLIRLSPMQNTQVYVATMAAVTGLTNGLAPLAGGVLMQALANWQGQIIHLPVTNYTVVFFVSAVLRLSGLLYLRPLQDADAISTRAALTELRRSSPRVWRSLRQLQRSTDEEARLEATASLAETRTRLAVSELEQALSDPSPAVRASSARALGEIGDPSSVEPLLAALNDPATGLGAEAARALGRLGSRRAVPTLIARLQEPCLPQSERRAAIRALGLLGGSEAAAALCAALETETDAEMTAMLARAAGAAGAAEGIPLLLRHLERAYPPATQAALIQALGEMGRPTALPALRSLLENTGTDDVVLPALADALARLDAADTLLPLLARLDTLDSPVARKQTAAAIGTLIGEGESVYSLLAQDELARESAILRLFQEMQKRTRGASPAPRIEAMQEAYHVGDYAASLQLVAEFLPALPAHSPHAALCRALLENTTQDKSPSLERTLLAFVALRALLQGDESGVTGRKLV